MKFFYYLCTLDAWHILVPGQCSPIIGATLDTYWILKKTTGTLPLARYVPGTVM